MQIKRVQCPKCKVVLDVKNSKNEQEKEISCPSCNSVLKIRFASLPQDPIEAHTFIAPQENSATQLAGSDNCATQLISDVVKSTVTIAKLIFGGIDYPLATGQNIIGRKANSSKATVQIGTEDRYMSRQHCSITITSLPDGNIKAILSNYMNKNATLVNGQMIETGDAIRLADGNQITMGRTTITFKTL